MFKSFISCVTLFRPKINERKTSDLRGTNRKQQRFLEQFMSSTNTAQRKETKSHDEKKRKGNTADTTIKEQKTSEMRLIKQRP